MLGIMSVVGMCEGALCIPTQTFNRVTHIIINFITPQKTTTTNSAKTQEKRVPTLCITAPDDIHQSDRDTLWTFHARNRGPSNTLEYSKLYADDSILDSNGSLVVKGHVPHRSQFSASSFPGRNFTMSDPRERSDSDGGKRYKFDLPEITPKINPLRFQTSKMVIPSIKGGPPVVSKGLQPLVSYSSFGYPSDDEEDHSPSSPRGGYLATSLPATLSHTEFTHCRLPSSFAHWMRS